MYIKSFHAETFPISFSVILTGVPCSFSIFRAQNENINLVPIISLSCFSLDLFGLLSFFSLNFCRGVLLDNPSLMRVVELSGGMSIEDGDPPIRRKGSVTIRNSQSCDQNYVWRNFKQTSKSALFENVA